MALTRLVGDIHGMYNDYKFYSLGINRTYHMGDTIPPSRSIQLGDFGVGFNQKEFWHDSINEFHSTGEHRFIRGNHDNPSRCKKMTGWIPDGTVENDVMFIGGAWSIDNPNAPPGWHRRTVGYDWWEDEQCSREQFEQFIDIYSTVRPRVMITHDCPHNIAGEMFWNSGFIKGPRYNTTTADALQVMFEIHQPDEWYFGHWHKTMSYKSGRTTFQCLGELDYIDVEL